METVIIEGVSLEETLTQASEKLAVSDEEIDYKIIKKTKDNINNIRVEVFRKSEAKNTIKEVIVAFLEKMGGSGGVEVIRKEEGYYANIVSEGMDGMLIGKSGRTLEAIQHVISRILHRKGIPIDVSIDVAGYREKKIHNVKIKAIAFAEEVKRTKRRYVFEPLPPSLRRVIHIALNDKKGIRTYTIGDGVMKKVVIAPSFK